MEERKDEKERTRKERARERKETDERKERENEMKRTREKRGRERETVNVQADIKSRKIRDDSTNRRDGKKKTCHRTIYSKSERELTRKSTKLFLPRAQILI